MTWVSGDKKPVKISLFVDEELISQHVLRLNAQVTVPVLGFSKDARYPTYLRIQIEEISSD